jgi:hypothetical protein
MSRKYFVDDPMSSRPTLLAGTLPVDHLAAMRLIVTPGTIIDAHAEAERKPKEHGDDDGTASALVPIGQWPVNGPGHDRSRDRGSVERSNFALDQGKDPVSG